MKEKQVILTNITIRSHRTEEFIVLGVLSIVVRCARSGKIDKFLGRRSPLFRGRLVFLLIVIQ